MGLQKISLVGKGLEIVRLFKDAIIKNDMNYVWIWKNDLVSCHNAKFIRPAHMVEWTFERPHNNRTHTVSKSNESAAALFHTILNGFSVAYSFEFWKINYFALATID